jgi:sulfur transfer protein SufE
MCQLLTADALVVHALLSCSAALHFMTRQQAAQQMHEEQQQDAQGVRGFVQVTGVVYSWVGWGFGHSWHK